MAAHSKQFAVAVFLLCIAMIVGAKWGKNPSSRERDEIREEMARMRNEQKSLATRDELRRLQEENAKKLAQTEWNSTKHESRLTELTEDYKKFKEEANPKLQQFSQYLDLVKKEQEKQARFLGKTPGEERQYLGIKFCWIPAGTFKMGSPETEKDRVTDENQVDVQLTYGFWMAKYETTQEEYLWVMGTKPSHYSASGDGKVNVAGMDTARFPVEQVNWHDAMEYCQKLTTLAHSRRVLPRDWLFTLPTEAQWEYACRAGTTTPFHFGEILNGNQANMKGDDPYGTTEKGPYLQRTTRVGSYPANKWNLHDMHGNVWEWCLDFYKDKLARGEDPVVAEGGTDRVLRGGSWDNLGRDCRSASRSRYDPANRGSNDGFRAVAVPAQ